jgi:hypothetical protein
MTQVAPMVSRILKREEQTNCVPFAESFGGAMSSGFDVCRVQDGHMKNVVEKTPRRTTFVISVSKKVLQLLSKLNYLRLSAITPTHRVMPLTVVLFFFLFFSSCFSN